MVPWRYRSIGVSNFNVEQLGLLLKTAKVVPAVNQVGLHLGAFRAVNDLLTRRYASTPTTMRKTFSFSSLHSSMALLSRRMARWRRSASLSTSPARLFTLLLRPLSLAQTNHPISKRTRHQSARWTCCTSTRYSRASYPTLGSCKRRCGRDDHE